MSARSAALVVFLVAFATLPLPMLGIDGARVPAARYVQLAAVLLGLVAHEGTGGLVGELIGLFLAHALVYTGVLAGLAFWLSRKVLPRLPASGRRNLAVVFTITVLVAASFGRLYDTPFHHASAHARLLELYR